MKPIRASGVIGARCHRDPARGGDSRRRGSPAGFRGVRGWALLVAGLLGGCGSEAAPSTGFTSWDSAGIRITTDTEPEVAAPLAVQPLEIGEGYVLARLRDQLGVETVAEFALRRDVDR